MRISVTVLQKIKYRRGSRRPEVRRDLGRRSRPDRERSPAHRRDRGVRHTTSASWSRRWATRPTSCSSWPRGLSTTRPTARARHAAHRRRADLDGAALDGDQRARARGASRSPAPGRHRHRHRARQGADHRDAGRPRPGRARRAARSRSSRASRESRPGATITTLGPRRLRRDGGRARRRAAAPTSARSTPTSTASSPPIRGSCPTRAQARRALVRGDARACRARAPVC